MSLQTCLTEFLILNTKYYILKSGGTQNSSLPAGFQCKDQKYNESQCETKLFSIKYIILCSIILKNVGNPTVLVPIDMRMSKH